MGSVRGSKPCSWQRWKTVGKSSGELGPDGLAGIQEDAVPRQELAPDGTRHHVARGELQILVLVLHEAVAVFVDQNGAFAAQGFREQGHGVGAGREGRGVELDELQVHQAGTGPRGHGETVARGFPRVGGVEVELAQAAGRQHHGGREMEHAPAVRLDGQHAHDLAVLDDQIDGEGLVHHPDGGGTAHGFHQGAHDLGARGVAGVQDAAAAVGGLAAEGERAGVIQIEMGSQGEQGFHPLRPLGGEDVHDARIVQTRARGQGIRGVQGRRVVLAHGGGDAALGPGAGAAEAQAGLGQHGHAQRRAAEGRGQAGGAGAHDQDLGAPDPIDSQSAETTESPQAGSPQISAELVHLPSLLPTASMRSTATRARAATWGSTSTLYSIVCSERRILGSVIRFMCGQRLQGRMNSTSG